MRACTSVVDGWMEFGALSLRATHCGRDERVSGCRMHDAVDEERDAFVLVSLSSKPVYTNASSDRTRRAAPRRCFFSVPHEFTFRAYNCMCDSRFFFHRTDGTSCFCCCWCCCFHRRTRDTHADCMPGRARFTCRRMRMRMRSCLSLVSSHLSDAHGAAPAPQRWVLVRSCALSSCILYPCV